jgi:hypothetical protein
MELPCKLSRRHVPPCSKLADDFYPAMCRIHVSPPPAIVMIIIDVKQENSLLIQK